ncbi:MAG: glycosyl hydrolase 53 family protein [Paludibacteraceae bacterium]|nr:glycosyl hydrolase 53 family protein [Paludibacteraceae bacterium]
MKKIVIILLAAAGLSSCYYHPDTPRGSFAKGADVSWLSEMEHDGVKFYEPSENGSRSPEGDCLDILQKAGANSVRLRVWVNHTTGWSNKADVVYMAKRAAKQGMRVMIDFHYSDFFADPNHQTVPAAWQDYSYEQLCEAVREHTLDVLYALKEEGVKPEWVQVGNETPKGMLWPVGRVTDLSLPHDSTAPAENHWDEYAGFTATGYKAVKEAFPDAQVIVHVDNAFMYRDWFFRAMEEHGGLFDMIGLSHYPMMSEWSGIPWEEANRRAEENIRALIQTFHKPVMIAEVGMLNWGEGAVYDSVAALSDAVMTDFMGRIAPIDSCVGIFYWEPQVYSGWRPAEYIPLGWGSYNMSSFTPEGQPSPALQTMLGWEK